MVNCHKPIEEYLRSLAGQFPVSDSAILKACKRVCVAPHSDVAQVDERTLDLLSAEIYMWLYAFTPSSRNNVEDSDGGWKHTEGGWQVSAGQRRAWYRLALGLYRKWGETLPDEYKSGIVIKTF